MQNYTKQSFQHQSPILQAVYTCKNKAIKIDTIACYENYQMLQSNWRPRVRDVHNMAAAVS